MNRMVDLIPAVKRETALPDDRFLGVGIAIPSLVSPDGETTVYGMSSNFTGVTRRFFSEYIPYPVKMYHDSETAGFAEIWRTTDRGNMIYLKTRSAMSRGQLKCANCSRMEHSAASRIRKRTKFDLTRKMAACWIF